MATPFANTSKNISKNQKRRRKNYFANEYRKPDDKETHHSFGLLQQQQLEQSQQLAAANINSCKILQRQFELQQSQIQGLQAEIDLIKLRNSVLTTKALSSTSRISALLHQIELYEAQLARKEEECGKWKAKYRKIKKKQR